MSAQDISISFEPAILHPDHWLSGVCNMWLQLLQPVDCDILLQHTGPSQPLFTVAHVVYRWVIDSRDDFTAERLAHLDDAYKIYRCKVSILGVSGSLCMIVGTSRQYNSLVRAAVVAQDGTLVLLYVAVMQ